MSETTTTRAPRRDSLDVGARVAVYWSGDEDYYKGVVSSVVDNHHYYVHYDDGDRELVDVRQRKLKVSTKSRKQFLMEVEKHIRVGSRVSIWWPPEKQYYAATVDKIKENPQKSDPHHLRYDDGDFEWTDLRYRKFKWIPEKVDRLEPGSRVSLWDEAKQKHYPATVTKIKLSKSKPHRISYDDQERTREWINLADHRFMPIDAAAARPESADSAESSSSSESSGSIYIGSESPATPKVLKKRKAHLITTDQKSSQAVVDQKRPQTVEEEKYDSASDVLGEEPEQEPAKKRPRVTTCLEEEEEEVCCCICNSTAKEPRATAPCLHVFCKACIAPHLKPGPDDVRSKCPICEATIERPLQKYYPGHAAFKAVEALNMTTGRLEHGYACASAASLQRKTDSPHCIVEACQSKRREDRQYNGYYWRFKGCRDYIVHGIPVEQVSLETGAVIETFPSIRQAQLKTGVARLTIQRVLERRGKPAGGGYFWRYKGEKHGPMSTNLHPVEKLDFRTDNGKVEHYKLEDIACEGEGCFRKTPVEQLDLKTGRVIGSFDSATEAIAAVGGAVRESRIITSVCRGRSKSSVGYFWRFKGSDALPPKRNRGRKVEQLCLETGRVLATFESISEAARAHGISNAGISFCCNSSKDRYKYSRSAAGFGWRFSDRD